MSCRCMKTTTQSGQAWRGYERALRGKTLKIINANESQYHLWGVIDAPGLRVGLGPKKRLAGAAEALKERGVGGVSLPAGRAYRGRTGSPPRPATH